MARRLGVRFDHPAPRPEVLIAEYPQPPGWYVHVPFCASLCPFCPYNKVRYESDLATSYSRWLRSEADAWLELSQDTIPSLYVGGGTPTLLLAELQPLLDRLRVSGERAIEVLPTHMTSRSADRLRDLGFDFVSLGVQSFDRAALHRLGRPGGPAAHRRAIDTAVGRFACVDVDLIFDTGFDSPQTLLTDLAICFEHGVDQVSTYPLMRFGFTPFGKASHDSRREHELLREASALAAASGYERRSVWTFNRPTSPSYTSITRPVYLGVGAGAASFTGRTFVANHFGLAAYGSAISRGQLPFARVARLSPIAATAYRAFWQAYTGRIPGSDPAIRPLLRNAALLVGLVRRDGDDLVLTPTGYDRYHDLERWVTYHLIEPLWEELLAEHDQPSEAR